MIRQLKWVLAAVLMTVGLLTSLASAKAQTYSGDTTGKPVFNRPVSLTALSTVGTAVHYETYSFVPATTGSYRIRSIAAGLSWDNYVLVYQTSFNPASPLTNLVALNDDFGPFGSAGFRAQALTGGTTYIIVTTGYDNTDFGAYTNSIALATTNGTTVGAPTFARPDTTNTNLDYTFPVYPVNAIATDPTYGSAVRYQAKTFTVPTDGLYIVASEATFDMYTILYKGTFNPASPLTNALIANDDFVSSGTISGVIIGLKAGQNYTFVTTAYANSASGAYYFSVDKLSDFRGTFSGSTAGRPTTDVSAIGNTFSPPRTGLGNAVPFRILQVNVAVAGTYQFQLLPQTSPIYTPILALYDGFFDNLDPAGTNLAGAIIPENFEPTLIDVNITFPGAGIYTLVVSGETNTDAGSFEFNAYGPGAITLTPAAIVTGSVALKLFVDNPPPAAVNFPVNLTFRPKSPSTGADIVISGTLPSNDGSFLLNIPEANYNVGIKSPRTLQKVVSNVNATTGIASLGNVVLDGVDSNDDNFSDVTDLLAVINSYNQKKNTPANNTLYKEAADYNFDGVNDVSDLLLIINNYNRVGQFLP